jgi:hypothetical protein
MAWGDQDPRPCRRDLRRGRLGSDNGWEVVAVVDAGSVVVAPMNRPPDRPALCPFDLQVWAVDRMLNFEMTDHPYYQGMELQAFDDPAHGRGIAVLLRRRDDGRLDIYRQPGLTLQPEMAQVGGELGEWRETPIDPARFDISPDGVDVDVGFSDVAGRPIQVRINDRDDRPRHRGTLLAPVGSVLDDPASLSLFLMGGCDLVRRSGAFDVRIDGRPVASGRLPVGWLHRRRLVKYSADPTLVVCNQAHDGPVATVDPQAPGDVELDPGSGGIAALRARNRGHHARLELAPALHVAHLRPRQAIEGTWRLGIDSDPAVVGGFWTAERRRDVVELVLDIDRGWRPTGLPPLMAAVTRLAPVFRSWPTTYRWRGTVILGNQPSVTARWERKGNQRDESYQRLTSSH